jgi:NYN domain
VENMTNATRRTAGPAALVPFKRLLDALVQELLPAARNARAYVGPGASALVKPLREAGFRPLLATRKGEDDALLIQDLSTAKVAGQRPDTVVVFSSDGDMAPALASLAATGIRVRAVVVAGSASGSLYALATRGLIELVEWDAGSEAMLDERRFGGSQCLRKVSAGEDARQRDVQ